MELMNDVSNQPLAESSIRRLLGDLQTFARREPAQTVAVALGAGLLINLLLKRSAAGPVTALGITLLHPVLLSFGLTKVLEICCPGDRRASLLQGSALPSVLPSPAADSSSSRPSQWAKP